MRLRWAGSSLLIHKPLIKWRKVMFMILLVSGIVVGVGLLGAWQFKEQCQLFEFTIERKREDVNSDLQTDWLDFKAKANIAKSPIYIKALWMSLIMGVAPASQLVTLRLSAGDLFKQTQENVDKWMSAYKINYSNNVENLKLVNDDYSKYLKNAWFSFCNAYYRFPKI